MPSREEMIAQVKRQRMIDEVKTLRQGTPGPEGPGPRPKKTPLESAISGTADMLTFGFSDELGAGARAAIAAPFKEENFGDLYDRYLNEQREHKAQAEEDNPGSYLAGNVVGGVLPAVSGAGAPSLVQRGFRALIPSAERGVASNLARGAAAGALVGAGQSNARPTDSFDKAKEFAEDVATGGATGGAVTGVLGGIGSLGKTVASKVRPTQAASVLLGVPTEAAELYVKNPGAVNAAKPRQQLSQDLINTISGLKDEVVNGSGASRAILAEEGRQIPRNTVADLAEKRAQEIIQRGEGVLDDEASATVAWLKNMADKFRAPASEEGAQNLSTNRVKDLIQSTRKRVDFDASPGRFVPVDDRVKAGFASDLDKILKSESPAYVDQMKKVAADASLLDDVSSLAGTPQSMDNLLARVQRERAFFPAQKIGDLDKRMGTNYLQDLKLSQARDAFDRGAVGPGGSRMVNLYKELGREFGEKTNLPFGGSIGALTGATVDRYGPAIGKNILDATARSREMLSRSDFAQQLGKYAPILKEAASRGPAALVTTNQYLLQDPEYRRVIGAQAEEQPRRMAP